MDGRHVGGGEEREAGLLHPVVEEAVGDVAGAADLEAFEQEFVGLAEREHEAGPDGVVERLAPSSDGERSNIAAEGAEIERVADHRRHTQRLLRRSG